MKLIPLIPDGLPLTYTTVGKLAVRIHDRALGDGLIPIPPPSHIFALLVHLFHTLFACYPDPKDATAYVNSRRYFRKRRIEREVRRQFKTAFPSFTDGAAELIVRSIFNHCQICNAVEMRGYLATVQGFQDY